MARLLFDADAKRDLRELVRYIGIEQHRPHTARKVAVEIYHECQRYSRNPLMAERRDDILPEVRLFTIRPYVVFYLPMEDGIRVLRVIHGARNFPALFS